jgi:pantetheine-phosphate adenylyltransferase
MIDKVKQLFKNYNILSKWNEPHRFYHNINHLDGLYKAFDSMFYEKLIDEQEFIILLIVALFHDIIYDPTRNDNEEKSIEYFDNFNFPNNIILTPDIKKEVVNCIIDTKNRRIPTSRLSKIFWLQDNKIFTSLDFSEFVNYERYIFKEYQFVNYDVYRENRIIFLKSNIGLFDEKVDEYIKQCVKYVASILPKVGVYCGTFIPLTIGHKNIIEKAEEIFDKVIIAFGQNPDKPNNIPVKNLEFLKYRQVDNFDGLVTDYLNILENQGIDVTLIRGLRNSTDFEYESNQIVFSKEMKSDMKIIFLRCDKEYEYISSSSVRSLLKLNSELATKYLIK